MTDAPPVLPNKLTDDVLALPSGPLVEASLAAARAAVHPSLLNHCIRGFYWARLFAARRGVLNDADYNEELLFAANVMHDLGTGPDAPGRLRFELEGADLAAAVLTDFGAPAGDVDKVWEAIAFHTTPQLPERMGLLTYLTYEGVWIDFGKNADLVAEEQRKIHAAYPRLEMISNLADEVIAHGARSETAAPPYALAYHLAQERKADGVTTMERGVVNGPWGE
ncbi:MULTISPECIES: HD domain-containing protein [Streptomyces]|uniref:HD domain-containing protein n=1 Tax=Streptomyces lonegramiae TaxID=3075524 RepID=A0ABU2X646_9ACTN|nr:HD domain-containing protein [Streptomyces sp. DSM 41529]MDT0541383.1 HD domain-containing protein [Streptomyces sp. DSM 41529]